MHRWRWFLIGLGVLILLGASGLAVMVAYYVHLPQHLSQHETLVLGQSTLVPGSTTAMRVVVRDSRDAAPLPDASVKVLMRPREGGRGQVVFKGTTDERGTLGVAFTVPESAEGQQVLVVETRSALGADRFEQPVTVRREYRVLVSTDKPIYQPGQVIHIRVLALASFDLRPAAQQPVTVVVQDGRGNTVFRKHLTASAFGVAAADFQLADELNAGAYKITAQVGNTVSEKTVTVEHYTLPKFEVALTTDHAFYRPGERVMGTLHAHYFFGKDVAQGRVRIEGYTYDVTQNTAVVIEGQTDAQGAFTFEFMLPEYLVGSELEGGGARFYLEARVTDQADHTEVGRLSLPVARENLIIQVVPEGGRIHVGVENLLYVLTSYPDGTPAQAEVELYLRDSGETLHASTGAYGLAELAITPKEPTLAVLVTARDGSGAEAQREFVLMGEGAEQSVLLRIAAPVYRVGETMLATILTSRPTGTVYLDIVREGQTVSTRAVDVEDGRAEVTIDLTPDLYGTLTLHAYRITRSGHIIRDTRLVVVEQADDLSVALMPDAEVYRPGDPAKLSIDVTGEGGQGVSAALGLAIVDESVFALAEQDPGFAKLYFLLERELLKPKYELHGLSMGELLTPSCEGSDEVGECDPELFQAREAAGKAALASAAAEVEPFTLQVNSHERALQEARQRQQAFFATLSRGALTACVVLPLLLLVVNIVSVAQGGGFWRSLGIALAVLLAGGFWLLGMLWLVDNLLWRLQEAVLTGLALLLGGGGLLGLLIWLVVAWRQRDLALGITLALIVLFVGAAVLIVWSAGRTTASPAQALAMAALWAVLLGGVALLLRAGSFYVARQPVAGTAGVLVGLPFIVLLLVTLMTTGGGMGANQIGGPQEVWVEEAAMPRAMAPAGALVEMPVEKSLEVAMEDAAAGGEAGGSTTPASGQPPRLRAYFPETMLWLPDAATDARGHLEVSFDVADSITTWRVAALASSQDGRLGSATVGLRVFQDFFIDLDLPTALTVGDEVAVPVGVFNYLPEPQTVRLELVEDRWFELLDDPVKEIEIGANDISVVTFRIRAVRFGRQQFEVYAYGSQMSDAIRKPLQVFPNGKLLQVDVSDRLVPTAPVETEVQVPGEAIAGTQKVMVKIYPGVVSQVVEGLDALLRMPFGCFEQTSSTTYPNILVLDYLKRTGQVSPEVQMKAESYINLGYQRLTTFEVPGEPGGFSLFGEAPADPMLTAYGLQEFGDMSRVYEVDPALVERIAAWLFDHQKGDGSWEGVQGFHETSLTSMTERVPVTAFVVWGLSDAGYADDPHTRRGVDFLRESLSQVQVTYDLALVANALVAHDVALGGALSPATERALDRLAEAAQRDGESVYWEPGGETYMGGSGPSGRLEVTAAVALAFLRGQRHLDLANAAITYLVRNKDSFGTWETTSATVLALKALIASASAGAESADAVVTIQLGDRQARTVHVTPESFDVVQMVIFDDLPLGQSVPLHLTMEGTGSLMYQVVTSFYLPWESLARYPDLAPVGDLVTVDVVYDRTDLKVDDIVRVDVTVTLNEPGATAKQAIIDLGLPPGFTVEREDLARLVARYRDVPSDYAFARVQRFELTGRQIILYVSDLTSEAPLAFSYRLRARFPVVAQVPASMVYDYYNPQMAGEAQPLTLAVTGP